MSLPFWQGKADRRGHDTLKLYSQDSEPMRCPNEFRETNGVATDTTHCHWYRGSYGAEPNTYYISSVLRCILFSHCAISEIMTQCTIQGFRALWHSLIASSLFPHPQWWYIKISSSFSNSPWVVPLNLKVFLRTRYIHAAGDQRCTAQLQ